MSTITSDPLIWEEYFDAQAQAGEPEPVHRAVCAWGNPPHVIREGIEPITHSICPEHAAAFKASR
jgi:hypothetical protein